MLLPVSWLQAVGSEAWPSKQHSSSCGHDTTLGETTMSQGQSPSSSPCFWGLLLHSSSSSIHRGRVVPSNVLGCGVRQEAVCYSLFHLRGERDERWCSQGYLSPVLTTHLVLLAVLWVGGVCLLQPTIAALSTLLLLLLLLLLASHDEVLCD